MSGPKRLLVVDDNVDTAELLADLLRLKGFEVAVAYSPTAALELAATAAPEIALLDIGLNGTTGYELGRQIRKTAATCRLIAVTGYADVEARARSLDEGFVAHFVKPVAVGELLHAITNDPLTS
jgi:DNA-binding response OmpR family regulator